MVGRKTDSAVMDETTKGLIYEGASISQLGQLFGLDNRTVSAKLGMRVQPCGKRHGYPIYSVRDAAPFLVEQDLALDDLELIAAYVQQLDPTRLPRQLTKEFWQAMLNKQKYEEQAGDLWRTEKVIEVFGELAKNIRTVLVLARDTVNNQAELSPRQHQVLGQVIDGILEELHAAVVKQCSAPTPAAEGRSDGL